ncbi:MAG: nitroreductase family protein [Microthrixaceae bacterium]
MSEFDKLLASRRMCRDFDPARLDEGVPHELVEAASRAPSAGNTHGLDFLVLQGERTNAYWDVTLPPERRSAFRWPGLLNAPLLMLPYVEPAAWARRYSESDKIHSGLAEVESWPVPYWYIDGGAAVMAVLLAAEDVGLGALFFGQFEHESALKEAFDVPADRRALGSIAVGNRAEGATSRSASARRGRPESAAMIHRDSW